MKESERGQNQEYDRRWDDLARERLNERMERRSRESLQKNLEEDRPDGLWQKVVKRITEPDVLGMLAAVGFATVMVADIVLNGPSEFVVNSPEAATTALALGAAAIGTMASHFGKKAKKIDENKKQQPKQESWNRRQK